jgi:hypothetical protein
MSARWSPWQGLAGVVLALLGLAAIVGSGGVGPSCLFCGGYQIPIIELRVFPLRQGVQVGESTVFYAQAFANAAVTLPITYSWCRTPAAGGPCVEVPGATDIELKIANANLADDGSVFVATVRGGNAGATAQGTLYVSNTPPVTLEDGEFAGADWSAPAPFAAASAPAPRAEQVQSGGNPGAFRRLVQELPIGPLSAWFFSTSRTLTYEPAVQGAIYGLELTFDVALLAPVGPEISGSVGAALLLEQGGRRYRADGDGGASDLFVGPAGWQHVGGNWRLARQPAEFFFIVDGPPCSPGEACPDFSAGAPPMRFGLVHALTLPWALPVPGVAEYGIDNWKLTVWRR